jgi:hypothetical protein
VDEEVSCGQGILAGWSGGTMTNGVDIIVAKDSINKQREVQLQMRVGNQPVALVGKLARIR